MARRIRQRKVTAIEMAHWERLRLIVRVNQPCQIHEVWRAMRDARLFDVETQLLNMTRVKDLKLHRVEDDQMPRFYLTLPDTSLEDAQQTKIAFGF